jgi:hypothetical protein
MDLTELNDRIRAHTAEDPNPKRVAEKVLANMSAAEHREVAALVLTGHVRHLMTEAHRRVPLPPDQPRRGRTPGVFHSLGGQKFASARQRDLADWQAITGTSLAAPGGGRKFFGEFTVEEITWLAAQRTAQAQALLRQADRYRDVARAMEETGAQRAQDLDPAVLLSLMRADSAENVSGP